MFVKNNLFIESVLTNHLTCARVCAELKDTLAFKDFTFKEKKSASAHSFKDIGSKHCMRGRL
jgi:hypothetical protein